MANSFHFVCSPERYIDLVKGIVQKRERLLAHSKVSKDGRQRALMVWEPVPELCIPGERAKLKEAIQYVDVISPNTEELLDFFVSERPAWSEGRAAKEVLGWGIGANQNGALVVRQGSKGCAAYLRGRQVHLRPYHLSVGDRPSRVVDPTGGGNAFLGALALAMNGRVTPSMMVLDDLLVDAESHGRLLGALIYATIAASFVIEQPGMPLLLRKGMEQETWNGKLFEDRLVTYLSREHDYITQQLTSSECSVSS
jgi:sugar/nucleoside kinase (ribokinase family)